jgi:hypothetical protein
LNSGHGFLNLSFVCDFFCVLLLRIGRPFDLFLSLFSLLSLPPFHSIATPRARSVTARPHVDLVRFRTARRHRRQSSHSSSSSIDDSTDSSASGSGSGSGGHKRSTRLGDLPTYAVQVSDCIFLSCLPPTSQNSEFFLKHAPSRLDFFRNNTTDIPRAVQLVSFFS